MQITPWRHKVQYYETDQMKIVHHSNYIRWFEEARVHMLEQIGVGYDRFEENGIISPVLSVESEYKQMVRFGETVEIRAVVEKFNGVRFSILYQVVRAGDNELCCTGRTSHCFLDMKGLPLSLKRSHPDFYEAINSLPTEF